MPKVHDRFRSVGTSASSPFRTLREKLATEVLRYARRIIARLHSSFPSLEVEQIEDVVSDAIADWCRFSAGAEPPAAATFLHRAAWRNARDLIRSESARRVREHAWRDELATEVDPEAFASGQLATIIQKIRDMLPDDRMRITFRLRAAGERSTAVYAQALGMEGTDREAIRASVKREKDRLDKYLRRDPNGSPELIFRRQHRPVEITDAHIALDTDLRLAAEMDTEVRERRRRAFSRLPRPAGFFPAFGGFGPGEALIVDDCGGIWTADYRQPGDSAYAWTVFDSSGHWLGPVNLPSGLVPLHIGSDFVLGRRADDVDVEFVELHALQRPISESC